MGKIAQTVHNNTKLEFDDSARQSILKGVETLYQAVSTTLGPRGRNVAIAKATPYGDIYTRDIIHDGVGVARSIELENEFENMGAQVLKESAQKTVDEVGDGTTVTIVLARAIIHECFKVIAAGTNPMYLRRDLEDARDRLLTEIEKYAKPISTLKDETYIATISAGDPKLGELVANTLHEMGADGIITIEEAKTSETRVERQKGMQLEHGYLHPFFVTNADKLEAVLENPYLLITDKPITSLEPFSDLLQVLSKKATPLVLISPDISGEALPLLLQNKMNGALQSLAIKAPSFGQVQKDMLMDIAILTGAKLISEDANDQFEDVTLDDLGIASHVTANKNTTIIANGLGKPKEIETRIKSIKKQIEDEDSEFEMVKLEERLAKMTNGVATIYVGGYTEIEMKERKERVDDSVHATRAAMKKGIVAGGEVIFLTVRKMLGNSLSEQILYRALEQPFNKLVSNAGKDAGEMREKLYYHQRNHKFNANIGYDVVKDDFSDFLKVGIIDPVLVPIKALENAISVAIQLITTGAIIVPVKEVIKNDVQTR